MKRWVAAVIVALVLVVPMQARAECAWVLWEESTIGPIWMPRGSSSSAMVVVSAFESLNGCATDQSAHATQLRAEVEKRYSQDDLLILPGTIAFRTKEAESAKAWVSKRFLCLPDTLDPRPRGSGR